MLMAMIGFEFNSVLRIYQTRR